MKRYYSKLQKALLSRGLMRTDGGGSDTSFDTTDMTRDFTAPAFLDEYETAMAFSAAIQSKSISQNGLSQSG